MGLNTHTKMFERVHGLDRHSDQIMSVSVLNEMLNHACIYDRNIPRQVKDQLRSCLLTHARNLQLL